MKKEARNILNAKFKKSAIFEVEKISMIFKTDLKYIILQQLNSMSAQNALNSVTLFLASGYTLLAFQAHHSKKALFANSRILLFRIWTPESDESALTLRLLIIEHSFNSLYMQKRFMSQNTCNLLKKHL